MIQKLKDHFINIPGWRTNRKIVVFESDDWGAQRMPSKKAYDDLLQSEIRVDKSRYDTLDSLEKIEDIENLFSVLKAHENTHGKQPKFTFNTVMGNPNFKAIKEYGFEKFVHESLFDSYQRYYGENTLGIWLKGIEENLIVPQFHAREHLNTNLWMKDLMSGNKETLKAFEREFYGLKTKTSSVFQKHYLSAYFFETKEELINGQKIIDEGLQLFKNYFGVSSRSFIGCNYVWPLELESWLNQKGVKYLQGQRGHIIPELDKNSKKVKYHYTGQKNSSDQYYFVRNVLFEPYLGQHNDWVEYAMQGIKRAFLWNKPAIISSHRINYVSQMRKDNRDHSLRKLDLLLKKITNEWPDVDFMSSDELGELVQL